MGRNQPILYIEDEDGGVIEQPLPTCWEICGTCRGNGKHSLAVDGHGITQEERERDWDDESWDDYRRGAYDQQCSDCGGTGKVQVVDEGQLDAATRKRWERQQDEIAETYAIEAAERRMGA